MKSFGADSAYKHVGQNVIAVIIHASNAGKQEKNMKKVGKKTEASQQYATAHSVHYTRKDLLEALNLYKSVMAAYPDTEEAKYSRSQILAIVNAVVPKDVLFDAQVELAVIHFGQEGHPDDMPALS